MIGALSSMIQNFAKPVGTWCFTYQTTENLFITSVVVMGDPIRFQVGVLENLCRFTLLDDEGKLELVCIQLSGI